uniref:PfEMP1 variant 1 of strain MC n=3 Tax=Plasmodium falciparum TaxID=5833 RepID=Q25733_PLAFA|nr:PfEMP1 variant 1 of strain MC [Plasmodium falciparum]
MGGGNGGGGTKDKDAKHALDRIGEEVYKEKVENDAEKYKKALKGNLQEAKGIGELASSPNPCKLVEDYYNNRLKRKRYPCANRQTVRFSDEYGGQCTFNRIKDSENNDNSIGACAPYRRLHLCDYNLEKMGKTSTTKHDLLLDVCMAAKYEGDSIKTHYTKHELTNPDTKSQLCTILARSFADIGDIVRGKDLYLGYDDKEKDERKKLENNLIEIFKKIHENLGTQDAKDHYKKDEENYYQLREDWWTANRSTVWKAITCHAGESDKYFRKTCCSGEWTDDKCRCKDEEGKNETNEVPTYFDYVPQYLRWFEEWAEDFCRKRKKKIENAIKNCRGEKGNERYCDLNGYNCEETARGAEIFVKGDDCHKCSVACDRFVKWIDNQRKEFDKQKKKYDEEINKTHGTTITTGNGKINNLYVGHFYKILKKYYPTVDKSLQKLNDEAICKKPPNVGNEKASTVDFNNEVNTTFSHTTYCEACPWCGAQKEKNGGGWKAKEKSCAKKKERIFNKENSTDIKILTPEKGRSKTLEKLKTFCKDGQKIKNDIWKCHYDDNGTDDQTDDSNDCVLGDWGNLTKEDKIMSYNAFFWMWVHDMLIDSIKWRDEHGRCINKDKGKTCIKGCNKKCICFQKWVEQKKTEWGKIKDHFRKQKDIPKDWTHDDFLQTLLMKDLLLEIIQDTYGDANEIKRIEALLEQAGVGGIDFAALAGLYTKGFVAEKDTTIDKLLQHEQKEADKCLKTHTDDTCPPQEDRSVARSESATVPSPPADPKATEEVDANASSDDEDDFEEEEEEEEDEGEEEAEEVQEEKTDESATEAVAPSPPGTTQDGVKPASQEDDVKVCSIVDKALKGKLDDACTLKYGKTAPTSWKCIPSGNNTTTESTTKPGAAGTPSGKDTGSICVPPRRRKLYVGKLHDWAGGETTEAKSQETSGGQKTPSGNESSPSEKLPQGPTPETTKETPESSLLHAFVSPPRLRRFLPWHKFKEQWKAQHGAGATGQQTIIGTLDGGGEETPDKLLKTGHIPPDFLRQMFYTLGDYRDILVGNTDIVVHTSGNKEDMQIMEAIQKKIEQILPTSGSSPSPPRVTQTQHSVENPRKTWWNENGKKIWEGMVCALTYNTDTPSGTAPTQIQEVRTKLRDENSKNPKIPQYKYDQVKLDDTSDAKTTGSPVPSGEKITPLTDFISRPPYFRYLEEWGETFCKERKKRLEKIKEECRGDRTGHEHCSGDGYDCTRTDADRNDKFVDLNCRDCHIQCRKYRKWIDIKFDEYHKQEKKYQGEYDKLTKDKSSGGDNNCCKDIEKHKSAAVFLKELKHCKNGQTSENKGNQEDQLNKLDFDKIPQTFSPSTYCKACPVYGVNCNGNKRGRGGTNGCTTNNEPENKENDKGAASTISILINDGSTNGATNGTTGTTDETLKECSDKYAFFKGLRKQEWTCQKKYGVNQCNLTNRVNDTYFDKDIVFNEFFQRWLRYFVHDYNILKHKIDPCIKKEKQDKTEHKCINGCNIKCECVRKWLEIKGNEWGNIKKHYNINSNDDKETIAYNVKSYFVDQGLFDTDYKKAQKVVEDEKERKKIWGCTGHDECSEKEKEENKNFITNLISELQDKITSCQNKHNPNGKTACDPFPSPTPEETDPLDDDTPDPLDDDQHTEQPKFCPPPPPPMTCVEKIAKELRVEAEGKINNELKGNGKDFNGKCNNVKKKNGAVIGEESCKFEQTYENSVNNINNKCKDNQNERFKIGQKWNFKYIGTIRKDLCIPPRREHMCLDDLSMLGRTTISDSSALLKKIQEAAKSERDDIIRKLLEQNSCDEHRICDAMKYSFADLGDIIRGRDLWNKNSKQKGLQKRLEYAFINIYNKLQNDKNKYEKDRPKYLQLRSDWWDANRKHIWNAMTCNAPDDAKFLKKNPNDTSGSSSSKGIMTTHSNCGYDKEPPDYDYIPQPFRWMQEWSESFCKLLNEEMEQFEKTCGECKKNSITCEDDRNGTNCENCKNQCEKYKKLIHNWKLGFDKYKEIYNEIYNNKDSKINSNEYFKKFLEKLKDKCKELNSSDKCIDEATHCTKYKFSNSENKNHNNYAFKNPPKEYEKACKCDAPDPLDNCPKDSATYEKACNTLLPTKLCESKTFNNDDDSWDTSFVQTSPRDNTGVLVPPRRRQICLKNITTKLRSIEKIDDFKAELMTSAYNEGKLLCELYKKDRDVTLQAMKYSFYDYGDIVKGTDLISTAPLDKLKTKLNVLLKGDGTNEIKEDRGKWWTENRTRVWHAMLCGYKAAGGKIEERDCSLPDDNTHQFLRWFREWSEHFCAKRQKLFNEVKRECASAQCIIEYGTIDPPVCEEACTQYRDYITRKIQEYRLLNYQYNTNFNEKKAEVTKAPEYFNDKCNDKCNCLSKYIDIEKKWKNMYDSFDDNDLKNKCICRQIKPKRPPKKVKPEEEHTPSEQDTPPPLPPKPDDLPPPAEEPFNRDILEKTIPFGIALALGSIAFLFLKKKTKSSVGNLFQILHIPKSDYDIPTKLSPNRYIPYTSGKYRGKRYIYLEGDSGTDSGYTDHYSDITSSSESEYEELDINDIYVPGSPKYKTLIEVVLEPSGNNTTASGKNTPSDTQNDIQNDGIPSSKITDNEWNTLKDEFISNMLQNEPNTEPNMLGYNVDNNTHPTTSRHNVEEKPFIMSIHDRDLYSGEEYSYNVNMVNNDIPISARNGNYSGIDLINDSLNSNKVDIYDELLKRKENELFGTNHTKKNTSTNSVAKNTNTDPIHNQLNLFHTWLDRHRDMCEKWDTNNKKEELLDKLKEEWNKDNNSGNINPSGNTPPTSDIPSGKQSDIPSDNNIHSDIPYVLNTDVSIQIHMDNPKPINEFSNMDTYPNNSSMDTILEDLDKPFNEPYYYDVQDDIYYDVHDHDTSTVDTNAMDEPSKVQIEMDVNTKLVKEKYPIADLWDI